VNPTSPLLLAVLVAASLIVLLVVALIEVLPAEANRLASEDGAGNGCRPCGSSPDPRGESPTTDTEA
jgi:hypothetical protein